MIKRTVSRTVIAYILGKNDRQHEAAESGNAEPDVVESNVSGE